MKRIWILTLLILTFSFNLMSLAEDETTLFDAMQNFDKYNNYEAKPVDDKEIDKAIEKVKNLHKTKRQLRKEKEKKGNALSDQGLSGIINEPYSLLQLPVNIENNGQIVKKGFYKAIYTKKDNALILKQGHSNITRIFMNQAPEPDTDDLYYINSSIEGNKLKIIYGAYDKHLQQYLNIIE